MTYILVSFLLLMSCWLIFGQKIFLYAIACLPAGIFIFTGNYIYASITGLLMFFLMNTETFEQKNKKQNIVKPLIFAVAVSALPIATYFSSKRTTSSDSPNSIFISIILGLLLVFVAASSVIGAGVKRTKGDKNIYE